MQPNHLGIRRMQRKKKYFKHFKAFWESRGYPAELAHNILHARPYRYGRWEKLDQRWENGLL